MGFWLATNFVLDFVLAFAKRAKSAGYAKSQDNGFSRIYGSSVTYKTVALFESYLRTNLSVRCEPRDPFCDPLSPIEPTHNFRVSLRFLIGDHPRRCSSSCGCPNAHELL